MTIVKGNTAELALRQSLRLVRKAPTPVTNRKDEDWTTSELGREGGSSPYIGAP